MFASLEARVTALEKARPGRKVKPVVVSEEGVCGIKPDSNSAVCPFASLYRRQKGCLGTACVEVSTAYYLNRKQRRRGR